MRFPGFTDEWKKTTLGEIGKTFNGLTGKNSNDFGQGSPYITYKSIFDNSKVDISRVEYVTITDNERIKSAQNVVRLGDIFFTTSSETPTEVGMTSVLLDGIEDCYLNSFCFGYRLSNKEETLPEYFRFYLRASVIRNKLSILAQGSTRFNISKNEVMRMGINLPNSSEQEKIAALLSCIDERITTQNKIIDNLQSLIKGLIQHLIRIGLEKGTWHNVMLSEVLQERNELNKEYYPVHSVSVSVGIVNQIEYLGRSFAAKDTAHYHVVRYGDIVYTKSPTGNQPYGIIKQSFCQNPVAVSPLYGVYDSISFEIGNILHYYFLNPLNTNNYLLPLIQKGAKNTINITNRRFLENSISLPISNDEIVSVSKTLSSLSSKIELENSTLDSLLIQRRYLLNQLFI